MWTGPRKFERHLAINAGAGIPARSMLGRVDANGDDVAAAQIDKRRRIDAERAVAVVPLAGELAVDVHLRKRHHAVEIQIDAVSLRAIQLERLAVPPDALPGKLGRGAARRIRLKRARDRPVVRQSHRCPRRVVEVALLGRPPGSPLVNRQSLRKSRDSASDSAAAFDAVTAEASAAQIARAAQGPTANATTRDAKTRARRRRRIMSCL